MAAGVGPGQQWLTAGFRSCDEVRPPCLTPLPPMLPFLLPSYSVHCVTLCLSWWIGAWGGGGGLNRATMISAVLTLIPVGHHSAEKLPSSPSPMTPVAVLICSCAAPLHPATSIVLLPLRFSVIWCNCTVVHPQLRCLANQSLLTSVSCASFKMNKQKEWGQLSPDIFLATGNFLYFERWNWILQSLVPDHWKGLRRWRI